MNPLVTSLIASSRHRLAPYPRFTIPLASNTIPSNDSITATFTRNSTATYIDDDGILQTAGIGVPRFQNGRYLCEPAATNLIKNSQKLSSWVNSWGGGVTLTSGLDTIAEIPAFRLTLINSVGDAIYGGDDTLLSLTAGTKYYASLFMKNLNSVRCSVAFWDTVKATMNTLAISWTDGVPSTYSNPTTITEITYTKLVGTGEYLVSFAYTVPIGSSTHRFLLFPEVSVVSTNSIIVTCVQLATTLTSYIPTTSTTVTRADDVLHYAVGDVITQGQGSLYCEFVGCVSSSYIRVVLALSDGSNSNRVYAYISTTGSINAEVIISGSYSSGIYTSSYVSSSNNKFLITYTTSQFIMYLNGVLVATRSNLTLPTTLNTVSAGCTPSGQYQANNEIGNIKYFKEALTAAEAIKITTL